MNERRAEGLRIATRREIIDRGHYWLVQRSDNRYLHDRVDFTSKRKTCTCKEFEKCRPTWCPHLHAIEFHLDQKGSLPQPRPKSPAQKTYPRNWPLYNKGRENEHVDFKDHLFTLCSVLPMKASSRKGGRPRVLLPDLVYATVMKIRSHKASKKMRSLLKEEKDGDRVFQMAAASTILRFLDSDEATEILDLLIAETAVPFKSLESSFSIDATSFPIPRRRDGISKETREPFEKKESVKAHISSGDVWNVITAIRLTLDTGDNSSDHAEFPHLVEQTAKRFRILALRGDSAYCSGQTFELANQIGASLWAQFSDRDKGMKGGEYTKAWLFHLEHPRVYGREIAKRRNAESTNSMLKREFPGNLFSKNDRSAMNEVRCIALIHNIDLLTRLHYETGMEIELWKNGHPFSA